MIDFLVCLMICKQHSSFISSLSFRHSPFAIALHRAHTADAEAVAADKGGVVVVVGDVRRARQRIWYLPDSIRSSDRSIDNVLGLFPCFLR